MHFRTYGISDGMPTLICSSGLRMRAAKLPMVASGFDQSGTRGGNSRQRRNQPAAAPAVVERLLVDENPCRSTFSPRNLCAFRRAGIGLNSNTAG